MATTDARIRPATAADQKLIRRVIRQARLNPLGIHWRSFVIAEDFDGGFIGCAQIKSHKDGTRELASLYIKPDSRGTGSAAMLINTLQDQAQSKLWLTCRAGLVPLYERFGFQNIVDANAMPVYFRRVWRLFKVFQRRSPHWEGLAVMRWERPGEKEKTAE